MKNWRNIITDSRMLTADKEFSSFEKGVAEARGLRQLKSVV
jgi:hypothetical protein